MRFGTGASTCMSLGRLCSLKEPIDIADDQNTEMIQQLLDGASHHTVPPNSIQPTFMPTICSFIPSLPVGYPFRVRIAGYGRLQHFMTSNIVSSDVLPVFEARLFIDGRCILYGLSVYIKEHRRN